MRAAVHDVHEGNGQDLGVGAADIFIKGNAGGGGGGFGGGEGNAENGVCAEIRLGLGAVEFDHRAIHSGLVERIETDERRGDFALHVAHGFLNTFAAVALFVAVAELDGLVLAG